MNNGGITLLAIIAGVLIGRAIVDLIMYIIKKCKKGKK